eukprot:CAMPEP_0118644816 /NCGR_PEP_ID=MMETSP0785-20121206/7154_1 /TAXON_ID=91992 /ORGANISM="Bolidomonas pacifica, Strain CCMP 1866" /LENGTH=209 /DNA_ID=CAMNT_0006536627 /DNA_START=69 /DNA_END=694 /DNA_ORIENTATION=+
MKLSLAHLKSDYVGGGSRQPWEIEKEREAEKRRIEEEKKKEGMKKRMSMVSGGEVKRAFFAQARKAHPGGQISSNKMEATLKFLKKKQARGEELTPNELSIIEKFVGVSTSSDDILAELDEKAKKEKKEREEKKKTKGASGGGGANKDCREPVAKKKKKGGKVQFGKGKKGSSLSKIGGLMAKRKDNKKEREKGGKARSQSIEDMLNGA